jgi:hypothetical protein
MANKLFVFGIGGTGSRVIKAFTMLMASGVKLDSSISKVIPIIIDPDMSNGDLNRTKNILMNYQEIRKNIAAPDDFFGTNIETLSQLINPNNPVKHDDFQFDIDGTKGTKFSQFIGDGSFSKENDALKELLFSSKNLKSDMDVGFKGHPNIGSVVLNQLIKSKQYRDFAQQFAKGDKIFVINSIFGGTGAAGFPLLLKNFRFAEPSIPNSQDIKDSVIGGLTVLPYFNVDTDDSSEIDSGTFIEKTKAALSYYDRAIIQTKQLNVLYYIGDTPTRSYDNVEGSKGQVNNAHFVELAGALSIVDFCDNAKIYSTSGGKAFGVTAFKEFGNSKRTQTIGFKDLDTKIMNMIRKPLSKFILSSLYLKLGIEKAKDSDWIKNFESKTDKRFFNSVDFTKLLRDSNFDGKLKDDNAVGFFDHFDRWFYELEDNEDSFSPFDLDVTRDNTMRLVKGEKPDRSGLIKNDTSMKGIDKHNVKCYRKYNTGSSINQLLKMLQESTEAVLNKRKLL